MARVVRALVLAWLIVVIGTSTWVGIRGRRLYAVVRTAQDGIEHHLVHGKVQELPERLAELERAQARLSEALASLQAAVAEFMVIWHAFGSVAGQFRAVRAFFTTK
jgi:hypothetical protein